jgi:sugar (pentulose or hexulose) kinase
MGAERELFAALDIGTSRIRVGVLETGDIPRLRVIADAANVVEHGANGSAVCRFSVIWHSVGEILSALGAWSKQHGITHLHLGICGQVSSLLRWDPATDAPAVDTCPIWLDSSCRDSVPALAELWDDGGAERLLGTCMPAATNWLAVKIHHARHGDPSPRLRYFQLADGVFQRLTGAAISHPTAQISLVDQRSLAYAPGMLKFLGITAQQLPELDAAGHRPMGAAMCTQFGLPPTTVCAGLQDTNAALLGFGGRGGDGLLLTGTSEIIGVREDSARAEPPARMIRTRLGAGWTIYGSSSSGGASVQWLLNTVLRRSGAGDLAALTAAAEQIPPGADGLLCLPYLAGERAPLWDARWSGSFLGLRAHHTDAHLFRALLEGVAFSRRQAAEAMECPLPARFRCAGGSTVNALWNRIRAGVLGRPLDLLAVPDLSLLGTLRHVRSIVLEKALGGNDAVLDRLCGTTAVEPDPAWVRVYDRAYARFRSAQTALDPATSDWEPIHA